MFSKHPDVVYDQLNEAHRFGEQTSFTTSFRKMLLTHCFIKCTNRLQLNSIVKLWIEKQTFSSFSRKLFLAINNLVLRPIETSCGAVLGCHPKL